MSNLDPLNPEITTTPSEEAQLAAVFLNWRAIGNIARPYLSVQLAALRQDIEAARSIKNLYFEVALLANFSVNLNRYFNSPSVRDQQPYDDAPISNSILAWMQNRQAIPLGNEVVDVQLGVVQLRPDFISLIEEPALDVQLLAVKSSPNAIQHIKSPSLEVQLAAVTNNGLALRHITNPSKGIQLAAVYQNKGALMSVDNPTKDLLAAAGK
jgi:hypothetical protein